ncbi:hypothetical protein [Stieleria mannarensis]|uniref:hypothetical protein n=1 Tax=Stieleria mannarensis TaxID=2755585 RepID=UPI0015FF30DC|nr:hypothetical protein [Rhodopirellula sp. JC639]
MTDRDTYAPATLDHGEPATRIQPPVLLTGDDQLLQRRLMQLADTTDQLITGLNGQVARVDSESSDFKKVVDT